MTEHEKMEVKLNALMKRVAVLEASVRPLLELEGVDANMLGDQALVSYAAQSVGSRIGTVCGRSQNREATAARRQVATLLHERAEWSVARIARALGRSESTVRELL